MQEASVLGFDPLTKMIDIEYSNETLMKLKFQSKEAGVAYIATIIMNNLSSTLLL